MWELWDNGVYIGEFSTTKIKEITKISGTTLSHAEHSITRKNYRVVRVGKEEGEQIRQLTEIPITLEEINAKKESLSIGDNLELTITQHDIFKGITIDKKEVCMIESLSKDIIVLRRKNGLKVTMTYTELCMRDRGRIVRS